MSKVTEEMTISDLLEWADSLELCTFEVRTMFDQDEVYFEKDGCTISLSLGRFAESVPVDGGKRAVLFDFRNTWNGLSGVGYASADLDDIAKNIELYAKKYDLIEYQMSLF